ncbi:MAG: hypothetical protein ICV64_10755 [Thermoleophilia bacterium]|nr:hypothetical protein [Thermoleophilia bacterium]
MTVATGPWDAVAVDVLERLRAGDEAAAWAAIDAAAAAADEVAVPGPAAGFREVGRTLYWSHRALPEYVRLQQEQVRRYEEAGGPVTRLAGVLYDLAAFTWPGWGDDVRPEAERAGREAACRCAELRADPRYADADFPLTAAMAHWVVGAHALAARELDEARAAFERARDRTCAAGADDALDRGYLALADVLARPRDPHAERAFEAVVAELTDRGGEEPDFLRDQLVTARRVFEQRLGHELRG